MTTILDLARECGAQATPYEMQTDPAHVPRMMVFITQPQLEAFAERIRADAFPPKFDAMMPKQEELAIQFCEEIAGLSGHVGRTPDPVRLLEMAESLYLAEVAAHHEQQPKPSIHAGSGAIVGDLSSSSCPGIREAHEDWRITQPRRSPLASESNAFCDGYRAALAASQPADAVISKMETPATQAYTPLTAHQCDAIWNNHSERGWTHRLNVAHQMGFNSAQPHRVTRLPADDTEGGAL